MANAIGSPFARFLTPEDYSAGQRAGNADVSSRLSNFANSYNIGAGMQDREAKQDQIEQAKVVAAAKWESQDQPTQQMPTVQPEVQKAPVVEQQAPVVSAPAAQSFPVSSTPSTMAPSQPAAQAPGALPTAAPVAAGSPTAVTATPAATPAIATTAAPTAAPTAAAPAALPATAAPVESELRARVSKALVGESEKDKAILQKLVQAGKITPEFAQMYSTNATAVREKDAERVLETETKIADIVAKNLGNEKTREEIKKVIIKTEDNRFNQVYQAYVTGGPQTAAMVAKEIGLDIDLTKTKDLTTLQTRAKRSDDFKAVQDRDNATAKAEQEAAAAQRDALGVGTGKDVPSGVREVVVNGPDGKPMVVNVDANGKRLTQEQITSMSLAGKKAGANSTTVTVGGAGGGAGAGPYGQNQLADTGKLGDEIAKADVKELTAAQGSAQAARGIYNSMSEIEKMVTDPKTGKPRADLPDGPMGFIKRQASRVGLGGKATPEEIAARVTQEAVGAMSAEAELVAAGRMKGQGQITESERGILRRASSGDFSNFTSADWQGYAKAMKKIQQAAVITANERVGVVQGRNAKNDFSSYKSQVPGAIDKEAIDKKWVN